MERSLLLAPLLTLAACGGTSWMPILGQFRGVENDTNAELHIVNSDAQQDAPDGVTIDCADGSSAQVDAVVKDGTLYLSSDDGGDCVVSVAGDSLTALNVRGDGDLTADADAGLALDALDVRGDGTVSLALLEVPDLTLFAGGTGAIGIDALHTSTLDVDLRGSGDLTLAGDTDYAHLAISGSGDFNGADLVIGELDSDVTGSGEATVNVAGVVSAL